MSQQRSLDYFFDRMRLMLSQKSTDWIKYDRFPVKWALDAEETYRFNGQRGSDSMQTPNTCDKTVTGKHLVPD